MTKAAESLESSMDKSTDKSLDRDCTTLSRHVYNNFRIFPQRRKT